MMFDLLFIGGSSADILLHVPRLPSHDEKLVAEYAGRQAGGMVANTACAAARLGMRTAWAGNLGTDENGLLMADSFREFGVDISLAQVLPDVATDFTIVLLDPSGERTILVVPTSPGPPSLDPGIFSKVSEAAVVYTLPQSIEWFAPLADAAHAGGGMIVVDVESSAPVQGAELEEIVRISDLVFCNRRGLNLISGGDDLEKGAHRVVEIGTECVCVTLGKRGAWVSTREQDHYAPGFEVPVVDTTGAGDCFHAAFLHGYLNKQPLDQVMRFANAAAAISVRELGPRAGLPTQTQVEDFLKSEIVKENTH